MEIEKQRQTKLQTTSSVIEVPANLSRSKAIKYANGSKGIPKKEATNMIVLMYMKIGAMNELPSDKKLKRSYLNDFWRTLYFSNNLCPGDIPFKIIMSQFTDALVQGTATRKGNNQAAICEAFNNWITTQDVRNRLYQIRDEMYPDKKPTQIPEMASKESIQDYTDEELHKKLKDIKPFKGIEMVDQMISELEKEIERRDD